MKIAALQKYGRRPGDFSDLPPTVRLRASRYLHRFCERWRGNLPGWRMGILVGVARRLALNPPTAAWGRSMHAKRGGYAVQRRYVLEGRTGPRHPARKAARVSAQRRNRRKAQKERERLGYPPPETHGSTNMDGI